jgi:hypothetical protein
MRRRNDQRRWTSVPYHGWIRASNGQLSIALKQANILDREIDKANSTTDRITGAQAALDQRLDATAVMCG